MPWDALPEHIDEPHEWEGTDWDNKWQRWLLQIKGFFFFGPRARQRWVISFVPFPLILILPFTIWVTGWSWWYLLPLIPIPLKAKWKSPPRLIFGYGVTRWESFDRNDLVLDKSKFQFWFNTKGLVENGYFPSVVQYWSPRHFLLTWPYHVSFHTFWPWKKPETYPTKRDYTIKEMISHRHGARFDKDNVYNFPSTAPVTGDFV